MSILNHAPVLIGGADAQRLYISAAPKEIPETKEAFKEAAFALANKVSYCAEFGDITQTRENKTLDTLDATSEINVPSRKYKLGELDATIHITKDEYAKYQAFFDSRTLLMVGVTFLDDDKAPVIELGFLARISECTLANIGKNEEFIQCKIKLVPASDLLNLLEVDAAEPAAVEDPEQGE